MSFPQDVWFWNYLSLLFLFCILLFCVVKVTSALRKSTIIIKETSWLIREQQEIIEALISTLDRQSEMEPGSENDDSDLSTREIPVPQFRRLRDFAPKESWEEELGGRVW
jgi:hypothetical protein